nr:hypothetical protein [uncultured Butyricimonas sp.]
MTAQKVNFASTLAKRRSVVGYVIRELEDLSSQLSQMYPNLKDETSLNDCSREEACVSAYLDEVEHCFDCLGGILCNIIREEAHDEGEGN